MTSASIGKGLTGTELGIRVRYEIRRELAPYVGVTWHRTYGATAAHERAHGQPIATGASSSACASGADPSSARHVADADAALVLGGDQRVRRAGRGGWRSGRGRGLRPACRPVAGRCQPRRSTRRRRCARSAPPPDRGRCPASARRRSPRRRRPSSRQRWSSRVATPHRCRSCRGRSRRRPSDTPRAATSRVPCLTGAAEDGTVARLDDVHVAPAVELVAEHDRRCGRRRRPRRTDGSTRTRAGRRGVDQRSRATSHRGRARPWRRSVCPSRADRARRWPPGRRRWRRGRAGPRGPRRARSLMTMGALQVRP